MAKIRLRYGFHKEAEGYAAEFREELGLSPICPIDPFQLATLLAVPIRKLSKDDFIPKDIRDFFGGMGSNSFSALTLFDDTRAQILLNDNHQPVRQHSSIMHELAHVLLGHPARPPLSPDGCRHFDRVLEKEADDLGWTILVPKRAALHAVEGFVGLGDAAAHFGVSSALLEYRIRKADARKWSANRAKKIMT